MGYLESKGIVHKNYTQNIDCLELKSGCSKQKVMFSHGSLNEAHCPKCLENVDYTILKEHIFTGKIMFCKKCNSPCKPKIVLYGEKLSDEFYDSYVELKKVDLCIIMGTSLKVVPFNQIPYQLQNCFRIVINKERVGYFEFDNISVNDIFLEGYTDDIVKQIIKDLELEDDFNSFKIKTLSKNVKKED
jgi:NAD-dependent histone deacetylase SIR2